MSPSARTTARSAAATARPTSPACAPWRSTPYAWPVTPISPPACDNTPERRSYRWPPSGSHDDFAETLGAAWGACRRAPRRDTVLAAPGSVRLLIGLSRGPAAEGEDGDVVVCAAGRDAVE